MQALIGKTGKMSLKRRIQELDVNKLKEQTVLRAKALLKDIKLEDVVIISAGAATFYTWVRHFLHTVVRRYVSFSHILAVSFDFPVGVSLLKHDLEHL